MKYNFHCSQFSLNEKSFSNSLHDRRNLRLNKGTNIIKQIKWNFYSRKIYKLKLIFEFEVLFLYAIIGLEIYRH